MTVHRDAIVGAAFGFGCCGFVYLIVRHGARADDFDRSRPRRWDCSASVVAMTLGVPVLWYAIGAALSYARNHAGGKLPFLACHAAALLGIPLVFLTAHEFDGFSTLFRRAPVIGGIACAYYGLAQIAIWYRFATSQRTHSAATETKRFRLSPRR